MATPPNNNITNKINNAPKRRSINSCMGFPYFHSKAVMIKKRAPRAIMEAKIKTGKLKPVIPLRIVITLYGNGVTPAKNTDQAPH